MKYLLIAIFFYIAGSIHSSYRGMRFEIVKNSGGLQEAIDSNLSSTTKLKNCELKMQSIQGIIDEKRH